MLLKLVIEVNLPCDCFPNSPLVMNGWQPIRSNAMVIFKGILQKLSKQAEKFVCFSSGSVGQKLVNEWDCISCSWVESFLMKHMIGEVSKNGSPVLKVCFIGETIEEFRDIGRLAVSVIEIFPVNRLYGL